MILKEDLKHQIMISLDHYHKKNKEVVGLMKYELGGEITTELLHLDQTIILI